MRRARLAKALGAAVIGAALLDVAAATSTFATATGAWARAAPSAAELDQWLGPIALYPDQLLGPMLVCAGNPSKMGALSEWLRSHDTTKGSEAQTAASAAGFDDCFVALVLFPDVVDWMAGQPDWMAKVGKAFAADRAAVFGSIQRLRAKAKSAGKLKSNQQQTVETKTTSAGEQVIVIEPSNPQVVYVPQYNATTVYTQPTTSTTVVIKEDSSADEAVAAGLIGFTAGIAIGAMVDNNYYYGPYGWHGGHMYNDAWDDWYDNREDAREDWQDHREDMADEYGDRAKNAQENRTDRRETTSQQRTERTESRTERTGSTATAASQDARGQRDTSATAASRDRSGRSSDAFSGYGSGKSERAASSRGNKSRSSSRSGGSRRR